MLRGKAKGKKHIQLSLLQPIIDKYPRFLEFLTEGEQAAGAAREAASAPADLAAELRRIEEGQARLERALAALSDRSDYTRKYIELLEKAGPLLAKAAERGGEQSAGD